MKKYFFPCLLSLFLGACKNNTPAPYGDNPTQTFNQEFTLKSQQQAQLLNLGTPELTVTLKDLDFTYCPPAAACFVGTNVFPKLTITDAQGQSQQLALPLARVRTFNPAWIDTTNIRANGRRYLLYYRRWNLPALTAGEIPQKKDISITLEMTK